MFDMFPRFIIIRDLEYLAHVSLTDFSHFCPHGIKIFEYGQEYDLFRFVFLAGIVWLGELFW